MRKRKAKKRPILPDPRFNDQLVTRFVNMMMWDGKKSIAFKIFYDAMDIVEEKSKDVEPSEGEEGNEGEEGGNGSVALKVWKQALSNVMPHVEVKSKRIGGSTFQIPIPIRPDKKVSTAMKNLISAARKRNEKSMALRLAMEILAAFKEEGGAFKTKTQIHAMADANKAYSHFRF